MRQSQNLTFAELNARANRIAHALTARGVKPETLVGLCLECSVNLTAAILGIHKAGAGYVPIDPYYPAERFAFLVEDANLKQVIALSSTSFTLAANSSSSTGRTSPAMRTTTPARLLLQTPRLRYLHLRLDGQAQGSWR